MANDQEAQRSAEPDGSMPPYEMYSGVITLGALVLTIAPPLAKLLVKGVVWVGVRGPVRFLVWAANGALGIVTSLYPEDKHRR